MAQNTHIIGKRFVEMSYFRSDPLQPESRWIEQSQRGRPGSGLAVELSPYLWKHRFITRFLTMLNTRQDVFVLGRRDVF